MIEKWVFSKSSVNWNRSVNLLLTVALLLPLLAVTPAPAPYVPAMGRVQPLLLQMAAAQPDAMLGIIVQKSVKDTSVEQQLVNLGGKLSKDLSIINAFAAQVPGKAITPLAQAGGVRWISLDAPVRQAGAPTQGQFTTWATALGTVGPNSFVKPSKMLSPLGSDGSYGYGSRARGAFAGFAAEVRCGGAERGAGALSRRSADLGPKLGTYWSAFGPHFLDIWLYTL